MKKVYLGQVNNKYGNGVFIPYSVGLLQAYAQQDPIIQENYEFGEMLYLRENVEQVAERWSDGDVIGLSCYIWNFEYTMALARAIRVRNKDCLIVCGGPHVPDKSEEFFENHPYVNIAVHGEGEKTFSEILTKRIHDSELKNINGISFWFKGLGHVFMPHRERVKNLDQIPSPYLMGLFDRLPFDRYDFHPVQETHRGCPFQCTFCDWGSATYGKVSKFSDERIIKEYDWFAEHKLSLLYNGDANFAMFERDVELTRKLVETKQKYGYPEKFRAAYAKNSGDRVFTVSKMLNDAGMSKGATLSFQSMDENTLNIVKRKNIGTEVFKMLMQRYRSEGIPTYSELIVGLPGESYESFANGLNTILDCGQHEGINVYACECLPNSELSQPNYRRMHGIKSVEVPVLVYHGTPASDPHPEKYELIVETNTLSTKDWIRCQKLAWAIQCFHCLGLTQAMAVFYVNRYKQSYRSFYENLLEFAEQYKPEQTLIGQVVSEATKLFEGIPEGKGWGIVDQRFGNLIWPMEEGSFLKLSAESKRFYEELYHWFPNQEVLNYQEAIAKIFAGPEEIEVGWNIPYYLEQIYKGNKTPVVDNTAYLFKVKRQNWPDLETYARECIWYQRKGGTFLWPVEKVI